ncbi:hypothetical protein AB674_21450 [Flavobacterium sp. ABG]|nr:hypothetical protein AB674_21450 [Flavobacterium sp. ABG]
MRLFFGLATSMMQDRMFSFSWLENLIFLSVNKDTRQNAFFNDELPFLKENMLFLYQLIII